MTIVARGNKGQKLSQIARQNKRIQNGLGRTQSWLVLDKVAGKNRGRTLVIEGAPKTRVSYSRPLSKRAQSAIRAWQTNRGKGEQAQRLILEEVGGKEGLKELLREITGKEMEFPIAFRRFIRLYFK